MPSFTALTPHGSRLVAVASRALQELDEATSRIGQTARESQDTLSVGAGLLMAANVLPAGDQGVRRAPARCAHRVVRCRPGRDDAE
ncbi:MAG TPA: hypothetical protein VFI56_19960, partial [Vicinamibacterales bacterium]|nr:hypothetical protein [Vicinamibacterales bacterium]